MVEFWHHRFVCIGRDLLGSTGPIPLLKTYHLELAAWNYAQSNFEYLHHQSPSLGNPFLCLTTLILKRIFLVFRWIFMLFNLCPLPLVWLVGTTEKSLTPYMSFPPNLYWYT